MAGAGAEGAELPLDGDVEGAASSAFNRSRASLSARNRPTLKLIHRTQEKLLDSVTNGDISEVSPVGREGHGRKNQAHRTRSSQLFGRWQCQGKAGHGPWRW